MELFRFILRNLSSRKLRTVLTILGIVIGIGAIITFVSLGEGMKYTVSQELEQLGTNKVIVMPRMDTTMFIGPGGFSQDLSSKDVELIENVKGVEIIVPMYVSTLPVDYRDSTRLLYVMGFPAGDSEKFFSDIQSYDIQSGRYIRSGEKYTAVVGSLVPKDVFPDEIRLGSKIDISGKQVKVVGILKPIGNRQDDSSILMPLDGLRDITGEEDKISIILIKARDDPEEVANRVEAVLEDEHGEDVFIAMTTDDIIEQAGTILNIISFVFIGIAAISLLVAGFGIMNTMLMSVMERTREIGTMKAIGATNHRIMIIFLAEAVFVGFIGGVLGIFVGYGASKVIGNIVSQYIGINFITTIPLMLIGVVLFFAVLVGVVSGIYPARRASKLDPIESLRYE